MWAGWVRDALIAVAIVGLVVYVAEHFNDRADPHVANILKSL